MIQPRLVWELARKDLKLFLADRRGVALCFGVPIVLASAFGLIFHRPDADLRPPLLVVAEEGPLARRVVAGLIASEKLEAASADRATALHRLADRSAQVVIVLPADFDRVASLSRPPGSVPPNVRLLYHPGSAVEGRWAEGVLTEVVLREAAEEMLAPLRKVNPHLTAERPFTVEREPVAAGGALSVHAYSHSFCGMALQYVLFWGMDSGLLFLRERRLGIWRRLRAAPVTRLTLLAGKALATALIALAQIAITLAFGAVVFGVTLNGSALGLVAVALAAALLSAATGLLVAGLGGNEARARSVAILMILTLSLLGGLWLPAFLLPRWAQQLALAVPTTWAARGLEGVTWQGMGLGEALRCAGALAGFSVMFLAIAWWGLAHAEARARKEGGTT